jgi:hypothetical protein
MPNEIEDWFRMGRRAGNDESGENSWLSGEESERYRMAGWALRLERASSRSEKRGGTHSETGRCTEMGGTRLLQLRSQERIEKKEFAGRESSGVCGE